MAAQATLKSFRPSGSGASNGQALGTFTRYSPDKAAGSNPYRIQSAPVRLAQVAGYRPPPPKKPLASRKICERMNGSGSAPITIDPGWPQPFQQTTYESGVFRGQTVTPPDDHWPL